MSTWFFKWFKAVGSRAAMIVLLWFAGWLICRLADVSVASPDASPAVECLSEPDAAHPPALMNLPDFARRTRLAGRADENDPSPCRDVGGELPWRPGWRPLASARPEFVPVSQWILSATLFPSSRPVRAGPLG